MSQTETAEWYYVGHYGQLGPLTLENMVELASDGVIERDTYVWNPKMPDWDMAANVTELFSHFTQPLSPPPTPGQRTINPPTFNPTDPSTLRDLSPYQPAARPMTPYGGSQWMLGPINAPKSDKNRLTAAFLNVIPGFGRFYLGHVAIGILQIMTSFCGIGVLWSWIDGVYILAGGVKTDGYGRELPD